VSDDRLSRLASRLLGEAEQASLVRDWTMVEELARDVLAIDPTNAGAMRLIEQANDRRGEGGGGDRRQLTAMFCDLVGSTDLADRVDPEVVHELTRDYQEACTAAIDHHGGSVYQFQGDGVVAYFCYPRSHEDDPLRAVLAGIEVLERMDDVRARARRRWGLQPAVRIGVHTGLVAVQEWFGTGLLRRGSVAGATPNLASRLQTLAEPGTLVVSDTTAELVDRRVETEFIGHRRLRGISRPIGVYRVVGAVESDGRSDIPVEHLTPLMGRGPELTRLLRVWDRFAGMWRSGGEVETAGIVISGAPGLGKSRLARLLRDHALGDGATVFEVPCTSRDSYSLDAVRSGVARLTGIRSIDPVEVCMLRLRERLADDEMVAMIADLLDIPATAGYTPPRLAPAMRRDATLDTLDRMLDHLAATAPVLLVVEDAHWADPTSAEWLERVARRQPSGVLLVVATRPDAEARWSELLEPVVLSPLDLGATAELVRAAIEHPLPEDVIETVVQRSDGVPLFAEHLARVVSRSPSIDDARAAIPNTLHDLLQAQLDAAGDAKGYAQIAATIGRSWDVATITNVVRRVAEDSGHPPPSDEVVQHAMAELARLDLVTPTGASARRLRFRHALVRDAAYESQLLSERPMRHLAVADELMTRGNDHTADVAAHLDVAGLPDRAVEWYVRASEVARARGEFREATGRLDRALELLDDISGDDAAPTELRVRIERGVTASATRGWAAPEVVDEFSRCVELCEELSETRSTHDLVRALSGLWSFLISSGDLDACQVVGRRLVSHLERARGGRQSASIQSIIGSEAMWRGDLPRARTALLKARDLFDHDSFQSSDWGLPHDLLVAVQSYLGPVLVVMGDERAGLAELEAGRARARRLDFPTGPFSAAYVRAYEAWVARMRHDAAGAAALADEVVELGERHGFSEWMLVGALHQAAASALDGRPDEAADRLAPALELFRQLGAGTGATLFLPPLAEAQLHAGRLDAADETIREAIRLAHDDGHRLQLAESHRIHAEVIAARHGVDDPEVARELDRAMAVATEQGTTLWSHHAAATSLRLLPEHRPGVMRAAVEEAHSAFGPSSPLLDPPDDGVHVIRPSN
jgi:class 3 adenylate cyclase